MFRLLSVLLTYQIATTHFLIISYIKLFINQQIINNDLSQNKHHVYVYKQRFHNLTFSLTVRGECPKFCPYNLSI